MGFNRLGRKSSHRKALERNMVTSLLKYERVKTTKAKAREIRRTAEKMITRAKVDSVHNRRIVAKTVQEKDVLNKLFVEIAPKFKERPGGYTRILKIGARKGDAADMVILELVEEELKAAPKKAKKKAAPKKAAPKAEEKVEEKAAEEAPVAEAPAAEEAASTAEAPAEEKTEE
ncbi:MAG: 50S ribosomal protein L17 [Spirochaetales bacterium]|nr:50S ribosomal protein L17 [Spirochaetales bacterium]